MSSVQPLGPVTETGLASTSSEAIITSPAKTPDGAATDVLFWAVDRETNAGVVEPPIVTDTPALGDSRLPLSSTARLLMVAGPGRPVFQEYVHDVVPLAGCQVEPPSVETSTPASTPPPLSAAVPDTVTVAPLPTVAPGAGEVIEDVGAVPSGEAVPATRPA